LLFDLVGRLSALASPENSAATMADTEDPGGSMEEGVAATAPAVAPVERIAAYLAKVVEVMMEDDVVPTGSKSIRQTLEDRRASETVAKFAADPHCKTLLVERIAMAKEESDEDASASSGSAAQSNSGQGAPASLSQVGPVGPLANDLLTYEAFSYLLCSPQDSGVISYELSVNVHFSSARTASLVFVKRTISIEADKSVASQLRVISLSEGSPYETLHSYVSAAVAPYFKSFVRESGT
jgi:dynein heavy chain 1